MWVTVNGNNSTEIEDSVVKRVLNLYPEEELVDRPVFQEAFTTGSIEYFALKEESEKILIPWQMFFLNEINFNAQTKHIEDQRHHKVSAKLVAKRKGLGNVTSKRIIDRLIRLQNFVTSTGTFSKNAFCGSLKGMSYLEAVDHILTYFNISQEHVWKLYGKGSAFEYIVKQVGSKNINVSRGVLTNKILPNHQVVANSIYKNTSGFVLKDDCVPFVFLPSEINPDEVESRQIYTLIYLLVIIGFEQYNHYLDEDFKAKMLTATKTSAKLYSITSELLMPTVETDKLRGQKITAGIRDELSSKFKVSPSAFVITLRIRKIITKKEYDKLMPPKFVPKKRTGDTHMNTPKMSTSVRKFCGQTSYNTINNGIKNGTLPSIQAQYLIFGAVNKKGFKKHCNEISV